MIFIAFQDRRGVPGVEKSETKVETSRQLQEMHGPTSQSSLQASVHCQARASNQGVCKQPVYSSNHDISSI